MIQKNLTGQLVTKQELYDALEGMLQQERKLREELRSYKEFQRLFG